MQQPRIDKKLQNSITLLILFIIIIFGVFFGVIKPQAKNLKNSNIELVAKGRELLAKEDKLSDLKKLENTIAETRTQSDILIKALPSEQDLPGLLVQVEAIAKNLDINLSTFTLPSESTTNNQTNTNTQSQNLGAESNTQDSTATDSSYNIKSMSFPFGMTGKYEKIFDFLEILQNNLRIFKINSVQIQAPDAESTDFAISLNITTYYIERSGTDASSTLGEN
ncbi:MAG: type 4a pilus biogenesis protein PilO [bacterium]